MAQVQSLRNRAYVVDKEVTLGATAGTTEGIPVGKGTLVLAVGFENYTTVPDVTAYTMNITDGTTNFAAALDFDNTPARTVKIGTTAGVVAANDTIDVVTTITGAPGAIRGRVFAVVVDINEDWTAPGEADRDQLA
jgi:tetrahydrodipicolinate N-succinyltransferase